MIIRLCPPIYTYPTIHFRKIDMTTKHFGGFIRFPRHCSGGDDAMYFLVRPQILHHSLPWEADLTIYNNISKFITLQHTP